MLRTCLIWHLSGVGKVDQCEVTVSPFTNHHHHHPALSQVNLISIVTGCELDARDSVPSVCSSCFLCCDCTPVLGLIQLGVSFHGGTVTGVQLT
jgi:hypothetical protein